MADIKDYTGKITSQHADKPKYMAMVEAVSQCFLDTNEVTAGLPEDFDLDSAVDAQLDDVGLWVGISRNISTPLPNVYFSLDTNGLGFDQGAWKGPFDPDNGITTLDNEAYRTLLRAKIGANHWDGSLESSKAILDLVFNPDGHQPFIPVTANNETFGVGDGTQTAFQLKYQGQNVYNYTAATLYRNDWQGNQQLYSTPRTNMLSWSSDLTNSAWLKTDMTISASAEVAPDGTPMQLVTQGVAGTAALQRTVNPFTVAGTYTVSRILKRGNFDWIRQAVGDGGGSGVAWFNLAIGTVGTVITTGTGTGASASISDLGNGCYSIALTVMLPSPAGAGMPLYGVAADASTTRVNNGTFNHCDAQAETSPLKTSYIPTTSVPVTVTDYVAGPFGQISLSPAPLNGATLSWTGQGTAYANGNYAFMIDNQDMTITIGVAGDTPSATQLALLTGGYITLKPQSVDISYYISPTMSGPLFGFDASNQYVAGFDQGSWGKVYS